MTEETTPRSRRVYVLFEDAGDGKLRVRASLTPPAYDSDAMIVLIARGTLPDGSTAELQVVSDPAADPMLKGLPGATGDEGPNGWTPMLAGEADGVRSLLKVTDWAGGAGTKPATGYIAESGIVTTKSAAFNFNRAKRIESYTVVTRTTAGTTTGTALGIGEQKVTFATAFPAAPKIYPTARANIGGRPVVVEVVSVTETYAVVRASQSKGTLASLLSAVFDLVGGITIDILAVEA